ncbi:XRE family transcriptional regulator [Streptomyces albus subsp. chlorinus]|uniref:DUF5753 domain-containing protein n=1 Tax=Streptomyces albus TaxID=1888 RepID=UPI00156E067C|nr:DUF5753 domain-containing protein [Streptomyces albus]NSC23252.1 XRE family transcriptional regulator [Streptomyces albus subsp. chlorinus]
MGAWHAAQKSGHSRSQDPGAPALWELAVADPSQFRERYRRYMALEAEAISLWHYAVSNFHGLLQTTEYARTLLAAGGLAGKELTRQVEARIGRRTLLEREGAPRFRAMLSEAVLRTPLEDPQAWQQQLQHLIGMSERPNVVVQVVPGRASLHALTNTDTMFLRTTDGRTVAWVETGYSGDLVEETAAVERLQLGYDAVRDRAMSPADSREFIERMLEEPQCA